MSVTQAEKARIFHKLHQKGNPLVIFNIWDAGGAKVLQEAGAKAIGTGSWSVAAANGYEDGEHLPLEFVLANACRIVEAVSLPVTIDFEGGYAENPVHIQQNIERFIETGAVGLNFEDQIVGGEGLYPVEVQCGRITAIRKVADEKSIPIFVNARSDVFLKTKPQQHDDRHLEEALWRANAYAAAGASGFFAPGIRNAELIQRLCEGSPLPVNILAYPDTPSPRQMAELGVSRISYGPAPYRQMMHSLKESGQRALSLELQVPA